MNDPETIINMMHKPGAEMAHAVEVLRVYGENLAKAESAYREKVKNCMAKRRLDGENASFALEAARGDAAVELGERDRLTMPLRCSARSLKYCSGRQKTMRPN